MDSSNFNIIIFNKYEIINYVYNAFGRLLS